MLTLERPAVIDEPPAFTPRVRRPWRFLTIAAFVVASVAPFVVWHAMKHGCHTPDGVTADRITACMTMPDVT